MLMKISVFPDHLMLMKISDLLITSCFRSVRDAVTWFQSNGLEGLHIFGDHLMDAGVSLDDHPYEAVRSP
jgi:hypothetical protein